MVATALLTGGTLYIGYQAYIFVKKESTAWWQGWAERLQKSLRVGWGRTQPVKTPAGFTQSAQARPTAQPQLAALVYPPLRIVCGPAWLYLGAATAQRGYRRWQQGEPVSAAVVEGAIIVICLAQGSFLVGSLGFTCYYLGQVEFDTTRPCKQLPVGWRPPLWGWRQAPAGEVPTPVNYLQVGDQLTVHAGEMAPVTGVIVQGIAWVRRPGAASTWTEEQGAVDVKVGIGQSIEAATIVLVGSIGVVVTAAPCT
ncbi:MAG: hypothetical protein R3C14_02850 [Caldilineaceae bacterium]